MLDGFGKFGWMIAFVYVACAAMRLARFNVELEVSDKRFFKGLPSPAAAGMVATLVWLGARAEAHGIMISGVSVVLVTLVGVLMVSNVPFPSFKQWNIGRVPFAALVGVVMLFGIVFIDPPFSLFLIGIVYILGSLLFHLWCRLTRQGTEA
jgi:CDP-diacylglycerol--serine O-phosphatidyltransferase